MTAGIKANVDGSAAIQVGGVDAITLTSAGAASFVTSPMTIQGGSAAAPSLTFSGDTNTGIFSPAADTIAFSEGGAEVARFDADGDFGIGTSSPGAKLDVATTTGFTFNETSTAGVRIGTQGATGGSFMVQTQSASSGYGSGLAVDGSYSSGTLQSTINIKAFGVYSGGGYGSNLAFHTSSGTTLAERMRIDSSGNLLVGTTSAAADAVGARLLASNQIQASKSGDWSFRMGRRDSSGVITEVYYNSSRVGDISTNGSNTTYNSASDYRLKENVQPMANALGKVAALKPVTFTWKSTGTNDEGFLAHELQMVVPQAVRGEKDEVDADGEPVYQSIDTSVLVATLTAALQELKAELDATKAEVALLKGAA